MTANVTNRKVVRQALAALLSTALVGVGKPAQALYRFKKSDFRGQSPVIVVASAPVNRAKQAQVTRVSSLMELEIHTFVLYARDPIVATNNPAAGSNVVINLSDTSGFSVGANAAIEDENNYEIAIVSAINPGVSITVTTLVKSYTTPRVYWLNEEISEDQMDLLEKSISDVLMDNTTTATWANLSFDGSTELDPVVIGGKEYNHEIIPVQIRLFSE